MAAKNPRIAPTRRIALIAARTGQDPKLTQREVARRTGIMDHTKYWSIENGYLRGTTAERRAIARALGVALAVAFPEGA